MENRTQKVRSIPMLFFHRFDHGAALKIERKVPHLNIAFDRYASIGTVMHYILVISIPLSALPKDNKRTCRSIFTQSFSCWKQGSSENQL